MTRAVKPFLKWPGGKRWLVPAIRQHLGDRQFNRYIEPFLGGGAVYFGLQPSGAVLSDINADLINTYIQVQTRVDEIVTRLKQYSVDKQTYLDVRNADPSDPTDQAVRFLYLNRTAFAGMYRLNRRGEFNVPFGGGDRTPAPLWTNGLIRSASEALSGATLTACDFQGPIDEAGAGDIIYCDPTYTVAHNNNGFVRYNERNFSWKDQQRLAAACRGAASRGAYVLVSNAVSPDVKELYSDASWLTVRRKSLICPDPIKRQETSELLLVMAVE